MQATAEEQQLIIDIVANLAYAKHDLVDYVLNPAGVPRDIYLPLISKTDQFGKQLSKRRIAPLLLEALGQRQSCATVPQRIIRLAANWDRWDRAKDIEAARATVVRAKAAFARTTDDEITALEILEQQRTAAARRERLAKESKLRDGLRDLLVKFEDMQKSNDYQGRGYGLEDLLAELFALSHIALQEPFRRNSGGEQIDGAFALDNAYYVLECRWRRKPADTAQVDAFRSKVERGSRQTMGLFLAINGWSDHVPGIMRQSRDKCVILMDGIDLHCVLSDRVRLPDLIQFKAQRLPSSGDPVATVKDYFGP